MNIPSPFECLDVDKELICDFFGTFSRFEFSLKEIGYIRTERGVVFPAWRQFADDMNGRVDIKASSELAESISYLCAEPPMVQVTAHEWKNQDLYGQSDIARSIDAACRVRNNLFHGGKHVPHSPHGRNQKLVLSALRILHACINSCERLQKVYVRDRF